MNNINQNLNFSNSGSSNQHSPRLLHCGEAYGAGPGFLCTSHSTISSSSWGLRSKRPPSLQTKGVTVTLVILQNWDWTRHTAIVRMMLSLLLAQDLQDLSEQQQVPPQLQTKGSKVCRQFTSRQKNIFLKRNNLFRIKQKQLDCEQHVWVTATFKLCEP